MAKWRQKWVAPLKAPISKLRVHGARAIDRLNSVLGEEGLPTCNKKDSPASSWTAPDPALVVKIEQDHGGMVAEQFALCQTMPLEEFPTIAERLRPCGYRPVRLRPYSVGNAILVAAVWHRDGQDWRATYGLSAEKVHEQEKALRAEGFLPVDVASYVADPNAARASIPKLFGDQEPGVLYTVLWKWKASDGPGEDTQLSLDLTFEVLRDLTSDDPGKEKSDFAPLTLHERVRADGLYRFSTITCRRSEARPSSYHCEAGANEHEYEGRLTPSDLQMDVCVTRRPETPPPSGSNPFQKIIEQIKQCDYAGQLFVLAPLVRGITDFGLGRDKQAVENLSIHINNSSVIPYGFYFRAMAHARLGHNDEAREDLGQAWKFAVRFSKARINPKSELFTNSWLAYTDFIVSSYVGDPDAEVRLEPSWLRTVRTGMPLLGQVGPTLSPPQSSPLCRRNRAFGDRATHARPRPLPPSHLPSGSPEQSGTRIGRWPC